MEGEEWIRGKKYGEGLIYQSSNKIAELTYPWQRYDDPLSDYSVRHKEQARMKRISHVEHGVAGGVVGKAKCETR